MAGSLRDQLVKAGLATVDQARKAERQARTEKHARQRGDAPANTDGTPAAAAAAGAGAPAGAAPQGKKGKKGRRPASDPYSPENVRARAAQLNAERAERDRELARIANEKAAAKALRAEIKQLAQQHDKRPKSEREDDVPYNFVHGKKIKRIYIRKEQQALLASGSLVIINDDGRYHMVPTEVAEKIRARDPKGVVSARDLGAPEPGADDEYYAKFKVPDDLDW
jgi:uncharacterized protein